jgi:hypothetical protein
MTEVLPETPPPAHDHQPPAMVPAPPHTIPPPVPPSPAAAVHHPGTAVSHPGSQTGAPMAAHRGREKLHWDKRVWDRLDHAVHKEIERTRVAAKFLPVHRVAQETTSVPSDIVIVPPVVTGAGTGPGGVLALVPAANGTPPPPVTRWQPPASPPATENTYVVDEGATTRLIEFWVEFSLTPQQVEHEGIAPHDQHGAAHPGHAQPPLPDQHIPHDQHGLHDHHGVHGHQGHSTAITLATRAANILAQAEDMLLFNGLGAFTSPLFTNFVRWRANGEPTDWGLLDVIPALAVAIPPEFGPLPASQVFQVLRKTLPPPPDEPPSLYGNSTFEAVTAGYAQLMGAGHYGPYALTLHNVPYADSFAPLSETLIMPADRIAPLMTAGFRDSGTLDAPGATAAAAGLAAATAVLNAGGTQAQAQQAAANAAATYAINYGVGLVVTQATPPANTTALAAAAQTGSLAAQAQGATNDGTKAPGGITADDMGQKAAFNAASSILNYPGLPQGGNPTPVAKLGLPSYYGSLVSLGGNTMDRVVGIEPTVGFMQQDVDGNFRFRVFERLALRLKDITAVIRLEFQ